MANLHGWMQGMRYSGYPRNDAVTRCGDGAIEATLETWEGAIKIELEANGNFRVLLGEKYSPRTVIMEGNVGNDGRYYVPSSYVHNTEIPFSGNYKPIEKLKEYVA